MQVLIKPSSAITSWNGSNGEHEEQLTQHAVVPAELTILSHPLYYATKHMQ